MLKCFFRTSELFHLHTNFKIIPSPPQPNHSQLIQAYLQLHSSFTFHFHARISSPPLKSLIITLKIPPHNLTTLYRRSYRKIPIISAKITPKFSEFKLPSYQDFIGCTNLFLKLKQKYDDQF